MSTWLTFLLATDAQLIESYLLGSSSFASNRSIGVGYDVTKNLRDLVFTYITRSGEK